MTIRIYREVKATKYIDVNSYRDKDWQDAFSNYLCYYDNPHFRTWMEFVR